MILNYAEQPLSPAVKRCVDNLQSPNPRLRSRAAAELGELQAPEALPFLIQSLKDDVNTYVRSAAAESLGHIGGAEAVFPLMDALRDSSSFVRRATAIALGQLQAKEAQVALLQLLEDNNFYVRRAAINAIGKLGVPDLGKVLLPLLETDDQRIRRTVITSLRRLRTLEAVPRLVEILEEYLHSPSPRDLPVVKTLVIALGELQTQEVAPVLIRVLRGYVGARSLAAAALGQVGDHRAGPALVESLADPSTSLRLAALKSLGNLGYVEAAPDVRRLLSFVDPRVRRIAARAAGQLKDHEAFSILVFMAREDPSPLVRPAAVEALTSLGDERTLEPLLALVADNNAYLRASLAFALCALDDGSPAVRQALERLTQDKVGHVAAATQQALQDRHTRSQPQPPATPASLPVCAANPRETSWLRRLLHRR